MKIVKINKVGNDLRISINDLGFKKLGQSTINW